MNKIKTTIAGITAVATIALGVVGFDVAVDNAPDAVQEAVGDAVGTDEASAHNYLKLIWRGRGSNGQLVCLYKIYTHAESRYWHSTDGIIYQGSC